MTMIPADREIGVHGAASRSLARSVQQLNPNIKEPHDGGC